MANPISVPIPTNAEQIRQLAEAVAAGHEVLDLVVQEAPLLVSGDAVSDVQAAWPTSSASMHKVVADLLLAGDPQWKGPIKQSELQRAELLGEPATAKLGLLRRLKDGVMKFWYDAVKGSKKALRKLRGYLQEYLEGLKIVVGSIPGAEMVVEIIDIVRLAVHLKAKDAAA